MIRIRPKSHRVRTRVPSLQPRDVNELHVEHDRGKWRDPRTPGRGCEPFWERELAGDVEPPNPAASHGEYPFVQACGGRAAAGNVLKKRRLLRERECMESRLAFVFRFGQSNARKDLLDSLGVGGRSGEGGRSHVVCGD